MDTTQTQAYPVTTFCVVHGISRALFYTLLKEGAGPACMMVRGRRLISVESARAWREQQTLASNAPPVATKKKRGS